MTPSGALTLHVHKDNAPDKLHLTPSGTVGVSLGGDFLSATLALGEEAERARRDHHRRRQGQAAGRHAHRPRDVKIDAHKKVSLQPGAEIGVDVLAGTVTAKIKPILDGSKISGVTVDGTIKDTKFTQPTPFSFQYHNGTWSADTTVGLKEIPGILHGGSAQLRLRLDGGFHAKAENIPLSGALQGLSIDEAHLDGKSYGASISGGKDITVGTVKISIDASSKLTYDSAAGLSGTAKGSVKLGSLPKIDVSVTANGTGNNVDIHADTDIPLTTVSKYLDGNLHVSYDRNAGANAFGFKATNVAVNADPIKNQVLFSNIEAHWDGQGVVGTLTAAKVNIKAGGVDVTVDGGTVDLLAGNKLNGDLKAHLTAGGANAHASVGWAMGQFKWEAGGTIKLGGPTHNLLEGEVEASAGTGAGGTIHNNGPISFGAAAPAAVKKLEHRKPDRPCHRQPAPTSSCTCRPPTRSTSSSAT